MKKKLSVLMVFILLIFAVAATSNATVIINSNDFSYGDSWDNPSDEVEAVLSGLQEEIYGSSSGDVHLNIVNSASLSDVVEYWTGIGVQSIILEELAGYAKNTTFGWYDKNSTYSEQIFNGTDTDGASASIDFSSQTDFGFYIDPNGIKENRMYTESKKNTHSDIQIAIFEIEEMENSYILGWEDLDLIGGTGGDRDYQDMIVRATIETTPVPEPATMFLLSTGLVGLAGLRRRRK